MSQHSTHIIEVLDSCQNGQLIAKLAAASDLSESQARHSLEHLVPKIAQRIGDSIADEEAYDDLLDILDEEEQTEILDDPDALRSHDAVEDGKDLLRALYGSVENAREVADDIGAPRGVDDDAFERLMTPAAALTFAAMARRNQQFQLSAMDEPEQGQASGGGIISVLITALITGFMQGFRQGTRRRQRRRRKRSMLEQIFGTGTRPRRRRRRRSTSRRRRRRRRRKTPSLTDLIGDIFD